MMVTSRAIRTIKQFGRNACTMTLYILNKLGILNMTIDVIKPVELGALIEKHKQKVIFRIEEKTDFPEISTGAYRCYVQYWCPDEEEWGENSLGSLMDHKRSVGYDYKYNKTHPTPSSDPCLEEFWSSNETNDWHFGFASVRQMKKWFFLKQAKELKIEDKFRVSVYTVACVKDVEHGKLQSVFDATKSKFRGVLDLDKLVAGKYSDSRIKTKTNKLKKEKEQK